MIAVPETQEEAVALRARAEDDFYFFCTEIMGWRDFYEPFHRGLCERVSAPQEKTYRLILSPRGHFKTTIATICYAMWRVLKNPNIRILLSHGKLDTSVDNLESIKDACVENDILRAMAPDIIPTDPKKEAGIKGWVPGRMLLMRSFKDKVKTCEATGADATVVGRHYDLEILDDLVTDDNYKTSDQREKVKQHLRDLRATFRSPVASRTVIIGTRWHWDDVYGELMDPSGPYAGAVEVIDEWRSVYIDDDPEQGFLFPFDEKTEKGWNETAIAEAQRTMKRTFNSQMRNNPRPEEAQYFHAHNIPRFLESDRPEGLWNYYTAVDPNRSDKTKDDPCAIVTGGIDRDGHIWIVDIFRGHPSGPEIVAEIRRQVQEWQPKAVIVETNNFQLQLCGWLRQDQIEHGVYYRILEAERSRATKKFDRITAMENLVREQALHVCEGREGDIAVSELTHYPDWANDDLADAFADIYQYSQKPHMREVPKKDLPSNPLLMKNICRREVAHQEFGVRMVGGVRM